MKQRGFTIVELLIVIVVIGILAVIALNTFNNVQQRARNTQRVSAANAYVKIVSSYLVNEGQYPSTSNRCLGENNPDTNGDGTGDCGVNANFVQNATLNTRLKTISTSLPQIIPNPATSSTSGAKLTGVIYNYDTSGTRLINGEAALALIVYYLEGRDQSCDNSQTLRDANSGTTGGTWTTGAKFTYSTNTSTSCYVALPPAGG